MLEQNNRSKKQNGSGDGSRSRSFYDMFHLKPKTKPMNSTISSKSTIFSKPTISSKLSNEEQIIFNNTLNKIIFEVVLFYLQDNIQGLEYNDEPIKINYRYFIIYILSEELFINSLFDPLNNIVNDTELGTKKIFPSRLSNIKIPKKYKYNDNSQDIYSQMYMRINNILDDLSTAGYNQIKDKMKEYLKNNIGMIKHAIRTSLIFVFKSTVITPTNKNNNTYFNRIYYGDQIIKNNSLKANLDLNISRLNDVGLKIRESILNIFFKNLFKSEIPIYDDFKNHIIKFKFNYNQMGGFKNSIVKK
jgi:hypothetical protein